MNHLPLRTLIANLKQAAHPCTLLGVGPVSEIVVRATFDACRKHNCPPIFIASRNQVDLKSLGHGYLMGGMDQRAFVDLLLAVAARSGYTGPLYICRDHGGPWQRNAELDGKYPLDRAMEIARQSFAADIEAGFNYLHIDPTKCPASVHAGRPGQLDGRTGGLLRGDADARARGEIDYEVGTEDIQGGLTTPQTYDAFLRRLTAALAARRLPLPTCVVGQTGTLCKIDRNVGRFDRRATAELVRLAAGHGVGFKEHNGDYLSAASCRIHPELGVTGMNVAPEFGLVETDALLHLADLESKLVREGWLTPAEASNLRGLFLEKTFADTPWKKWMTDDIKKRPAESLASDAAARLLIARVCGHYVYDDPAVKKARETLYANIDRHQIIDGPHSHGTRDFVLRSVRGAVSFYIRHFQMAGVNDCSMKP